jgi:hypothetical protein
MTDFLRSARSRDFIVSLIVMSFAKCIIAVVDT